MKNQALFSSKDKSKKLKCCPLQFLFGEFRANSMNSTLKAVVNYLCMHSLCFMLRDFLLVKLPVVMGGGRVVRRCWVNFQCQGVLQF